VVVEIIFVVSVIFIRTFTTVTTHNATQHFGNYQFLSSGEGVTLPEDRNSGKSPNNYN
jgi:hypothetical protein